MDLASSMLQRCALVRSVIDQDVQSEIAQFVQSHFMLDGGVAGRDHHSDLYYAPFAFGVLQALNRFRPSFKLWRYIRSFADADTLDFIHLCSLIRLRAALPLRNAQRQAFVDVLELYRSRDGGFNHTNKKAVTGTVYGSFLALIAFQSMGLPSPVCFGHMVAFDVESLPTAHLAALLVLKSDMGIEAEQLAILLHDRASPAGGFMPGPNLLCPDLLSTGTALFALSLSEMVIEEREAHVNFVESCLQNDGGFSSGPMDCVADVEYTFYGLLALGSLLI